MTQATQERYERPLIMRRELGSLTKQWDGGGPGAPPIAVGEAVDGVSAQSLKTKYGSPLYVVSEATLRKNLRGFRSAFRSRYPETVVAYSYKTNYVSGICATLHQEGAWAEVVSGFELERARALGMPGSQIVYNGPYKPFDHLLEAARLGVRINVDNLEELADLEEVSGRLKRPVKIGIRVNMRLNDPPWDKFGFNMESGQALEVCRRIHGSKLLRLAGLHLHAGTYLANVEIYKRAITGLLELAMTVEAQRLGDIEYVDLGGGYASRNTILSQLLPGEMTAPSYAEYAEAISAPLKACVKRLPRRPLLILEPGRSIVDDAVTLLVSVVAVKKTPDGRTLVVVDGGVNLLPTAYYFRHDVVAGREVEGDSARVDIVGPLCMQIDVLRRDVSLPPVSRGSILLFRNAGAYTVSNSMQFIYPRPPVVVVSGRETHVLRRGERTEDLVRLDELPAHLAPRSAASSRNGHKTARANGNGRGHS
jgi:diaminopimelate decarboxylase